MAPPISYHPQTSRQAKKNYLKKRANPCLSESEIRRLNRDVELYERAQSIKRKEERRKSNLKKKDEKIEREREARRKAGLSEIREDYISPRQQRLGAFVGLGKRKRGPGAKENITTTVENPVQLVAAAAVARATATATATAEATRSPLQAKSPNAVVKPHMAAAAAHARKKCDLIDLNGNNVLPLGVRVARKGFLPSISAAIAPTIPNQEPTIYMMGNGTTTQVEHTTELLGLISTQDLQFSDDDDAFSSSSNTILADDDGNHDDQEEEENTNDNGGVQEEQQEDNDFADADFEELAQDLEFSAPPSAVLDLRQVPNPKKELPDVDPHINGWNTDIPKISRQPEKKTINNVNDDSLFDEFAPLSQDLLDLVETTEYDTFEISTQDIRILDP